MFFALIHLVNREPLAICLPHRFAAGVAAFGMVLRGSKHRGLTNYESVMDMAGGALGQDEGGYRREFMELVRKAKSLHPELR